MNKKNIALVISLIIFSTASVLPMKQLTTQEEQMRRDHICRLSQANALGLAQYLEKSKFSPALIKRDIAILEKDIQQAMKNKRWAEGYFYSWLIPGSVRSIVIGSKLGSLAAGIFTAVDSVLAYDVWNGSSVANGVGRVLSVKDKLDYLSRQSEYNRFVLGTASVLPVTFAATLVLAGIARYSSYKLSNYKNRNMAFIQEMQERQDRDSIVIAQLQQIAYDARGSK